MFSDLEEWGGILSSHFSFLIALAKKDWELAYDNQRDLFTKLNDILPNEDNWIIPLIRQLARDLRIIARKVCARTHAAAIACYVRSMYHVVRQTLSNAEHGKRVFDFARMFLCLLA
jgi:hypothetical protein